MAKKTNVSQLDDHRVVKQAEDKLLSSGLTLDDAKLLNLEIIHPHQASPFLPGKMGEHNTRGLLKFNYHDLYGNPLVDKATKEPYWRVRLLGDDPSPRPDPQAGAFGSNQPVKKKQKPPRYFQAPRSLPHPYFPTNLDEVIWYDPKEVCWSEPESVTWAEIAGDPLYPVIITEGELKAAKACQMGFATIGLGGVQSWKGLSHGITFLEELDVGEFLWEGRRVYLCFDSDIVVKPEVYEALEQLAEELMDRGANSYLLLLNQITTEGGDQKTGLDDFFVHVPNPIEPFKVMIEEAHHFGLAKPLLELNHTYAYITDLHAIIDTDTLSTARPAQFRDDAGHLKVQVPIINKAGRLTFTKKSAAQVWVDWPMRRTYKGLDYQPLAWGERKVALNGKYNAWPGWGTYHDPLAKVSYPIEPREGDIGPFLRLLDNLLGDAEPQAREWLLRWLAYPIQHPGAKMLSAVLLWGAEQGTGKSVLGNLVGALYGKNFVKIVQRQLHSTFNNWVANKQFVLGEEITGSGDKREDANAIKDMITGKTVDVNEKYLPQYTITNCANYYFTSNHPDAFYIEPNDRRFFVHHVTNPKLPRRFYAEELKAWEHAGGLCHLFHHLLHLDLGTMHHEDPAYETEDKQQMIRDVGSDLDAWVYDLSLSPDAVLRSMDGTPMKPDLYTSRDLLNLYRLQRGLDDTRMTPNAVSRAMDRYQFRRTKMSIKTHDGLQNRYYIVRNHERWAEASAADLAQHLNQGRPRTRI